MPGLKRCAAALEQRRAHVSPQAALPRHTHCDGVSKPISPTTAAQPPHSWRRAFGGGSASCAPRHTPCGPRAFAAPSCGERTHSMPPPALSRSAFSSSRASAATAAARRRSSGGGHSRGRGPMRLACSLTDVEDDSDLLLEAPAVLKEPRPEDRPEALAAAAAAPPALTLSGAQKALTPFGTRGFTYGPRPGGPETSGGCGSAGGGAAGGSGEGTSDSQAVKAAEPEKPPPPPVPESRSPEDVVSAHVDRQSKVAPERLDPAGAHDDRQPLPQAAAATTLLATPAEAEARTHGSLRPLDDLRPPRRPGGGGSGPAAAAAAPDGGRQGAASDGNGGGVSVGVGGGGGADGSAADPQLFAGLTMGRDVAVPAVPCSTVGYGTRADVVARLPASIMLLRHAECMTLDELQAHERVPNHDIPLSQRGVAQARQLGRRLRPVLEAAGMHLFMYTSPFLRCSETARLVAEELREGGLVSGCREAVQLREQDWGNFQDPRVQAECKAERLRYGRFYYRFPSGESVADVYDRLTIFQDHLVRDMCAGRFSENTCVAVVTHGLTLRVFSMRWMHWTVRQFLQVFNVANAEPVLLHKDVHPSYLAGDNAHLPFMPHHTKCLYRLTPRALELLRGADPSMAASDGCWHGRLLAPPRAAVPDPQEEERQWADVDGMV